VSKRAGRECLRFTVSMRASPRFGRGYGAF
jgi:hypothetical protein